MAPKQRAPAKAVAPTLLISQIVGGGSGSAKVAPKRKRDEAALLIDQYQTDLPTITEKATKSRKLQKRDTETQVSKAIKDNFGNFSDQNTDVLLHEGMTLRERLLHDKRRQKAGEDVIMGSFYYSNLRKLYGGSSSVASLLKVKNKDEPIRATLHAAITAFKGRPSHKGPFQEWLQSSSYSNQRETIGIFKTALECRPAVSKAQCQIVMDTMRWVDRNRVYAIHQEECRLMKRSFDDGLRACYCNRTAYCHRDPTSGNHDGATWMYKQKEANAMMAVTDDARIYFLLSTSTTKYDIKMSYL